MFIIWGTKSVVRKLGYVADFCPICRDIETFELYRMGLASHVYGLSFGEGRLAGHLRKCLQCGTDLKAEASAYKDIQNRRLVGDDLIHNTFPNIRQVYAERLSLEEQVAKTPARVDATARASLIKEPFHILAPIVEKRFASTHIDWPVGVAFLGTIAGLFVVANLSEKHPLTMQYQGEVILVALAIGLVTIGVQGYKSAGRYLRREIYPTLGKSLRPLKPSQAEIENALAELKRMGFKLAKKARAKELFQALVTTHQQ